MPPVFHRLSPGALAGALALLGAAPAWAAEHPAAEGRAREHLQRQATRVLGDPDQRFEARDAVVEPDGSEHVRFDRRYRGLRVIGGDLIVHSGRGGQFREATQTLRHAPRPSAWPRITAAQARQSAMAGTLGALESDAPELVLYARDTAPVLAWDVTVRGQQTHGTPMERHVLIDAQAGQVLDRWDDVQEIAANGTGRSFFSGTVALTTDLVSGSYALRDPSRGSQYTINMRNRTSGGSVITDADNLWGNGALTDTVTLGVDAQYGASVTWDYYKQVHGRLGIANNNRGAYSRVHYGTRYNNAFWTDSCFCMTYGDGDGVTYNPFDSIDVAGHEMTHGVTSRTARLIYSGESGGLNEATSDIVGTLVEFHANNPNDPPDYLIGEKLFKAGGGKALRYMYSPNTDGKSADCWHPGVGALNVHASSGVANHFFYLLAEGSANPGMPASPTCQPGDTMKASGAALLAGIGRDAAARIWYRALTLYMTSSTGFAGARAATLSAATDLHGAGSPQVNAVAAAWSAVLVN